MRRLLALIAGVLAIPMAFSLFLAPAAEASTSRPLPTPTSYTVQRTFGPFDGEVTRARRIAISCRNRGDVITAHRATINGDRRVIRLRDLGVSNRRTFAELVRTTGRLGEATVTLRIRCQRDRIFRERDRGPVPTPLARREALVG